ncbi:hypothetical protein IHE44_0000141 [Lamprotornis superbus]|uniref:Peptidase M16C associated domain-containing protein n=1 Tax=Lamprotornis superbus TaxID=245042 RepID=A0A835U252_9PASS|nr:hypothetical protein IHE44_0000141 [Lamprotornis superbus]
MSFKKQDQRLKVTAVPELFLTAVKLSHDGTGARYLHVAREDSNNLFSIQFRTTPMDSTGVPHILEHTVLCGSQKYPCRDPFFKMLNRSLSTFMNAFTASDYTLYPFSTQNPKDFQNLLSLITIAPNMENFIQLQFLSGSFAVYQYIASCWNQDGDPVELLKIADKVSRFRQCLKENPRFLQEKVKTYFKDNPHKLTLSMSPEEDYHDKQAKMEAEKLEKKVNALSEEEKTQIFEKGLELIALQSKPQDTSCLPALKVSDIEPKIPFTVLETALTADEIPVQYCAQPTNGVVYFRAVSSLNTLPEELKPYVPLFCNVITKMGCGALDYREQAQKIELKTGGMSVSPHIIPDDSHLDVYEQGVLFSSLCLDRNLPDMMNLWSEIFNNPRFEEEEHFRVLVKKTAQELSNGIPDCGHLYASIRASKNLTPSGELQEMFSGMDQVKLMKRIAEMSDIKPILRKLPRIKKYLLNSDNIRCSVNAAPQQIPEASKEVEKFLKGISRSKKERKPVRPHVIEDPTFKPCQMKTHFVLPFPVNYVGECIRTVPYTAADYASLRILARLMTAKFLHTEIREKGGAYGGGAKLSHNGIFTFYSYRDPNSLATLKTFEKAVEWAKSGEFTQQDIDEAKLSVFAAVDAPIAPPDKGMGHFLHGISDEMKQSHREQLFAVNSDNLVDVSNKYLAVGKSTRGQAVLGPENADITKDPSWGPHVGQVAAVAAHGLDDEHAALGAAGRLLDAKANTQSYLHNSIQGSVSTKAIVCAWHIVANSSRHHTHRNSKLLKAGTRLLELQTTFKGLKQWYKAEV